MKEDDKYGGIVDSLIDNILEKYGITDELVKKITNIIDNVVKNIEVQEINNETYITININKINIRFKK
jgi:plasmid replication initiation protein